jgi:archaellum component FlaC
MLKKNKVKTEYITSKDLAEQTKIILGAIDGRFNKVDDRFDKMDDRFDRIDNRFDRMDTRIDELETELKADINNVQILIDGYVKAQEDFKQEFIIMKEEIKQIKLVFKEKLGVEIRAF